MPSGNVTAYLLNNIKSKLSFFMRDNDEIFIVLISSTNIVFSNLINGKQKTVQI